MTDARMPERWLNDIRFRKLSDHEFRTFTMTLMWAVANRTDGYVLADDLAFIPDTVEEHTDRLVELKLWAVIPGGWIISDFEATQTSREQLEGLELKKRQDAVRARNYRGRKKAEAESRDQDRDPSRDDNRQGQDRQGQDRQAFTSAQLSEEEKDAAWNDGIEPMPQQVNW